MRARNQNPLSHNGLGQEEPVLAQCSRYLFIAANPLMQTLDRWHSLLHDAPSIFHCCTELHAGRRAADFVESANHAKLRLREISETSRHRESEAVRRAATWQDGQVGDQHLHV